MTPRKLLLTATTALSLAFGGAAQAETFRLGTNGDLYGLDPHSMTDSFTVSFLNHIYEALVRYDANRRWPQAGNRSTKPPCAITCAKASNSTTVRI